MNDDASQERQALINSVKQSTDEALRLFEQLAFEKARADRMETAIREVLRTFPELMPRPTFRHLERSLTR